jgi:hypothetical protein
VNFLGSGYVLNIAAEITGVGEQELLDDVDLDALTEGLTAPKDWPTWPARAAALLCRLGNQPPLPRFGDGVAAQVAFLAMSEFLSLNALLLRVDEHDPEEQALQEIVLSGTSGGSIDETADRLRAWIELA